jgi:DeoR/GlpR family transcriptional regulator of sugar metabolism
MYTFALTLARSRKHFHIYTRTLPTALASSQSPGLTVSVIGGTVDPRSLLTEGDGYDQVMHRPFDMGVFSCMAISPHGIFSDGVQDPVVQRRLIHNSRGVLIGVVGSKLAERSSGQLVTSYENLAGEVEWMRVVTTPPRSEEGERVLGSLQQKLRRLLPHVSDPLTVLWQ